MKKQKRLAKLRQELFLAKINGEKLSCRGCGHILITEEFEDTGCSVVKCGIDKFPPQTIYGAPQYWWDRDYPKLIHGVYHKCDSWHVASKYTLLRRLDHARNKNKIVEPITPS